MTEGPLNVSTRPCPSCGTPILATALICKQCGYNIRTGEVVPPRQASKPRVEVTEDTPLAAMAKRYGPVAAIILAILVYYTATQPVRGELRRIEALIQKTEQRLQVAEVHVPWFALAMPARVEVSGSGFIELRYKVSSHAITKDWREVKVNAWYDTTSRVLEGHVVIVDTGPMGSLPNQEKIKYTIKDD